MKLRTSASFRAVSACSHIIQEYQAAPLQPAAPNTIWRWVRKLGYHALTTPKTQAKDWIIVLDESVQIGPEKLLVILAIRESQIDFSRPLQYTDLEPVWMSANAHWNGELIGELLERVQDKLGHIIYAVGDYGSDLKKGLRVAGIPHIHDITHHIALILKRLYADDPDYQHVTKQFANIRQHFKQTTATHLLPPKPRRHSRYHDLRPLAEYGRHVFAYLRQPPPTTEKAQAFREAMTWVLDYQTFFEELDEVTLLVHAIERIVKHHGLSPSTLEQCSQHIPPAVTSKARCVKFDILLYGQMTLAVTHAMDALLCTSDILESAFGKYKTYLSCNPMAGITDLALCIAAFTCSLESQEVIEALETTRNHDLTHWAGVFIGPTELKKRQQAFSDSDNSTWGEPKV
jgi:hypothetical protein